MLPDDGEVAGLLALMLLTDARRPARTGPDGELIPLAEQDRTRWDRALIAEGIALITGALAGGAVGRVPAAGRDRRRRTTRRRSVEDTDWPQILALYGLLERMTGNPMVALNRAVAAAMVHGPAAGLDAARGARRAAGRPLPARRGARPPARDGRRHPGRVAHYRAAAARTTSIPEQQLPDHPGRPAPGRNRATARPPDLLTRRASCPK